MSVGTVAEWRRRNCGPPWTVIGNNRVRYRLSDVNAYALKRRSQRTRLPALWGGRFPSLKYVSGRRVSAG